MTPGQHFRQSSAPRSPTPASRRRLGRSRLRPFGLPCRRSHDQPSRRTLLLRALGQCSRGDGLMYENAAGLGCVAASLFSPWYFLRRPLWANGGSGSIPKMLRRPKPPLRGDPQGPTEDRLAGLNVTHPAPVCFHQAPFALIFIRCISVILFTCAMLQTHSSLLAEKVLTPNLNASVSSSASASFK